MLDQPYKSILTPGMAEYVAICESFTPAGPDTTNLTPAQQRENYDNLCASFSYHKPDNLEITDIGVDSGDQKIPTRIYRPNDLIIPSPCVVFFHGGGWVVGSLDTHQSVCIDIANACQCVVIAVDYRLAPEHKFPAAFDDAYAVARHVYRNHREFGIEKNKIVTCGDSAGGNLSAAVCHQARETGEINIKGQALIYPGLGAAKDQPSHIEHANAPLMTLEDCNFYYQTYFGSTTPPEEPTASPLAAENFSGLPTTFMLTAECDPLRDDGRLYAAALTKAGVSVAYVECAGLLHGFLRARNMCGEAGQAFQKITDGIRALLND